MKIYEAKSTINFFGGLLSSKEILASYDSLVEGSIFKSVIHKKYCVDKLSKAVEIVNAVDTVESHGGLEDAMQEAHKDCFAYDKELLAACYLVNQCS